MWFVRFAVCSRWKEVAVGFDRVRDWISRVDLFTPFCDMRGKATYRLVRKLASCCTSKPTVAGACRGQWEHEQTENDDQGRCDEEDEMEPPESSEVGFELCAKALLSSFAGEFLDVRLRQGLFFLHSGNFPRRLEFQRVPTLVNFASEPEHAEPKDVVVCW